MDCGEKVCFINAQDHCEKYHDMSPFCNGDDIAQDLETGTYTIIKAFGHTFYEDSLIRDGRMIVSVRVFGSKILAGNFEWDLCTTSERFKPQLEFSGPVLAYEQTDDEIVRDNLAFDCSIDVLKSYRHRENGEDKIKFHFEIHQKRASQGQ